MHGKVYADAALPPGEWRRELQRFATKLGLPAGLAGIFAVGAQRPLDLWLVLFQGFSTAIAVLSIAIAIAGGTAERPSARYWIDALGFGLAAFVAHITGAALR